MRIVSLLPSTTEIVAALGLDGQLVGRSHECDRPGSVRSLPVLTEPKYKADGTSYEIDQRIRAILKEGLSVYRVHADRLAAVNPHIILTQDHCEVCAVPFSEVESAVHEYLDRDVEIVSVAPTDLKGIFDSIRQIGAALDASPSAEQLVVRMQWQFEEIQRIIGDNANRQSVVCIEWIDPLMTAGNWVPELVEIAGGESLLAQPGEHSPWIEWERIRDADPDFLLIMPCGYGFGQTMEELPHLQSLGGWAELQAVRNGRVFLLDGNHYFNRPGPRIADSARILAEILHTRLFEPTLERTGWARFDKRRNMSSI